MYFNCYIMWYNNEGMIELLLWQNERVVSCCSREMIKNNAGEYKK